MADKYGPAAAPNTAVSDDAEASLMQEVSLSVLISC